MTRQPGRSRGFSLIELMVAMVIGLLLLGGLVILMVNSKKNYATQDYSARLQENARFAIHFLSYDIRMAGYYGCSNDIINDTNIKAIAPVDSSSGSPDGITITYGEPYQPGTEITLDPSAYDAYGDPDKLFVTSIPQEWKDGDTLVIGDCGSASIADIAAGGINPADNSVTLDLSKTSASSLGRIYDPSNVAGGPITVRLLVSNDYTIAKDSTTGVPTLMRNNQPLVEGVENMQLLYQSLTGGAFVTGASPPSNVAAVQLAMLVRSVSNENLENNPDREYGSGAAITEDKGQYTLLGQNVAADTPTIRGQRHVFNTALAVRNRPL